MEQNRAANLCYSHGDSSDDDDDDTKPGLSICVLAGPRAGRWFSSMDFRFKTPLIPGKENSLWKRRAFSRKRSQISAEHPEVLNTLPTHAPLECRCLEPSRCRSKDRGG